MTAVLSSPVASPFVLGTSWLSPTSSVLTNGAAARWIVGAVCQLRLRRQRTGPTIGRRQAALTPCRSTRACTAEQVRCRRSPPTATSRPANASVGSCAPAPTTMWCSPATPPTRSICSRTALGKRGDVVVLDIEHHANLLPWQCLREPGWSRVLHRRGHLAALDAELASNPLALLAITAASNVTGEVLPISRFRLDRPPSRRPDTGRRSATRRASTDFGGQPRHRPSGVLRPQAVRAVRGRGSGGPR